ncbi:MAG: maleylpyruvate isomerase family mycothiol-dependent enzyme [Acidimicrobiales bacterium]
MSISPAGPVYVVPVLRAERPVFVELLRSLEDDDWARPTECPAYDVQGVAAHILGDDLSLLSRQRDGATPGLLAVLGPGGEFRDALDRFNDRWVDAVSFLSPPLLVELLEVTGHWTADWYDAVDPDSLGEPVGFFRAGGPSPYWQIAAREYVERWVHHHQIRRALGLANLDDAAILQPAVGVAVRGLAAHLDDLGSRPGDAAVFAVDGLASWTLVRDDDGWSPYDRRPRRPRPRCASISRWPRRCCHGVYLRRRWRQP